MNNTKDYLDKENPIPLYYQLKQLIKEKIETGELKPGDLLPSERELKDKYEISRPTIRQALKELVHEGLLKREKGRGTFVAKPKINYGFIQKFTTFYDDMEKQGIHTETKILQMKLKKASKLIARKLDIDIGEKIIFLYRVRYIDKEPIVSVMNYIPYKLCPKLIEEDLENKSLYKTMSEKYGITPYKADITLEPVLAEEHDVELLNVQKGSPIHHMENITYDQNDNIIDYFESRFRGDKGQVKVKVYSD